MKTIGNIITVMAAFMFMLGMCMIDGNPVVALTTMFVSGVWLATYGYYHEAKQIKRGKW